MSTTVHVVFLDNRTRQREHSAVGGGIDGMLADYALLEEDGIVKLPGHLSLEEGATLPCAGVTVWNAMMEHAAHKRPIWLL